MTQLKIGDTVKRISGFYDNMGPGNIDIIVGITLDGLGTSISLKKFGDGHDITKFQLVNRNEKLNWKNIIGEQK